MQQVRVLPFKAQMRGPFAVQTVEVGVWTELCWRQGEGGGERCASPSFHHQSCQFDARSDSSAFTQCYPRCCWRGRWLLQEHTDQPIHVPSLASVSWTGWLNFAISFPLCSHMFPSTLSSCSCIAFAICHYAARRCHGLQKHTCWIDGTIVGITVRVGDDHR